MRLRRYLKAFLRARRGATAIEFALVGAPFLVFLLALLETSVVVFANVALENAVTESARLIRTGQAQNSSYTAAQFKTDLCDRISAPLKCDGNLQVEVKSFSDFASVSFTSALDASNNLQTSFTYSPGNPGDIVLVRAFYVWQMITPQLGISMSNMSANSRLLTASAAFRNEPYNE